MKENGLFLVSVFNGGFVLPPFGSLADPGSFPPGIYLLEAHFFEETGLRGGKAPRYEARGFVVAPDIDEARRLVEQWLHGEMPCVVHPAQVTFVKSWPEEPEEQGLVMDGIKPFIEKHEKQE